MRYTDAQVAVLRELFEKVQNKENWKMPIDAIVELTPFEERNMREAVEFFAACVPNITKISEDKLYPSHFHSWHKVTAIGYYAAVGA